jgi:uncharacterized protein
MTKPHRTSRHSTPIEEDEMDELNQFLLSDATSDETMMLDTLDGYLTAIVTGPASVKTSEWLPGVWGSSERDEPAFDTFEEAQHILDLILDQRNGIVESLQQDPDRFEPVFDYVAYEGDTREYLDGEMWAHGFMRGIKLREHDWKPFLDDPDNAAVLRPIYLLGAEEVTDEEEKLVETPAQREELAKQIPACVAAIYRYWLPHRKEVFEQAVTSTFQREQPKTGRNDPCPCGSSKKFKKCCGAATTLH